MVPRKIPILNASSTSWNAQHAIAHRHKHDVLESGDEWETVVMFKNVESRTMNDAIDGEPKKGEREEW